MQQARSAYQQEVKQLEVERLKFIDESGINLALTRLSGGAPRGERAVGNVPINYGPNINRMVRPSI